MRKKLTSLIIALVCTSVLITACGDGSTILQTERPSALQPSFAEAGSELQLLKRTVPLTEQMSTAREIGPKGGTLRLRKAGIVVKVPAGALDHKVHLRLIALPGDDVAFEFKPHGITFNKPLRLRIFVEDTEVGYLADQNTPNGPIDGFLGVYWEGDLANGLVPLETFPVEYKDGRLIFETDHFSGYAMAL